MRELTLRWERKNLTTLPHSQVLMETSTPNQSPQRQRFKTTQDWHNFIGQNQQGLTGDDLFDFRVQCYKEIEKIRERPLLIYASSFIGTPPGIPNSIDLSDIDGFTDLVSSFTTHDSVDILIHSPGGSTRCH